MVKIRNVGGAHVVFEVVAPVLLPMALQITGGDGDLVAGSADDRVVIDPVGLLTEQIEERLHCVASRRHLLQIAQMLFTAAARVVDFVSLLVADGREIAGVKESAVVSQFRLLVAVTETT